MGQKTAMIEVNPREAEILANANRYRAVINLGKGSRAEIEIKSKLALKSYTPLLARRYNKNVIVYGIGEVGGIEVNALYGTFKKGEGWKLSEGV